MLPIIANIEHFIVANTPIGQQVLLMGLKSLFYVNQKKYINVYFTKCKAHIKSNMPSLCPSSWHVK